MYSSSYGRILSIVDKAFQDNEPLFTMATENHFGAFRYVIERLRDDEKFILKIVSYLPIHVILLRLISIRLRNEENFFLELLMSIHPNDEWPLVTFHYLQ